jgi:cysteine desulfurase
MNTPKRVCYLDYNATTIMPKIVLDELCKWATRGNASSTYPSAYKGKALMDQFRQEISDQGEFSLVGPNGYTIIFTSGGSEANSWIITSATRAYAKATGKRPHIITSNVEHDSIRHLIRDLEQEDVDVTIMPVVNLGSKLGSVDVDKLESYIKPNTCLISIMAANNETGVINDMAAIGHIAKRRSIPFHSDAVQLFAKTGIKPVELNITAFSCSFHKLYGPSGCGLAVVQNSFLEGYNLRPLIAGSQNYGLRGGTEAIHNIAASRAAFTLNFKNREATNQKIYRLKLYTRKLLSSIFPVMYLDEFKQLYPNVPATCIVLLTPVDNDENVMGNTIFISIFRHGICNKLIREALADEKIYVSIGSACKINDPKASHVLAAIGVPTELYGGVLRVSLGDYTEKEDIEKFVVILTNIIRKSAPRA